MVLNCHSFICVVSHHILEDLFFLEHLTVLSVPSQPQTRGLVIEIVGYTEVIRTHFMNCAVWFVYRHELPCCKYIHFIFVVIYIVYIYCLLVLPCVQIINILHVIDIHGICFNFNTGIGVICCDPSIFYILLFGLLF